MAEKNTRQVGIHLTEESYEAIRLIAFEEKKSISAYIRDVLEAETKKRKKKQNKEEK